MNVSEPRAALIAPLFPSAQERDCVNRLLDAMLDEASGRIPDGRVSAAVELARFRSDLVGFDFSSRRALRDVLAWTVDQLEHGIVQVTHPRYFGLFNPAPAFPAECAERIVASFNPQLASATTSPVPVAIEAHVIRAIADRAGMPAGANGHFTTGGSEANFTALVCAMTRAHPGFASRGARAFDGSPRIYVSEDAHLAWFKAAHQSGLGRGSVTTVSCDDAGCMDSGALAATIDADVAHGCFPIMIVGTAGTTNAGMVDPLRDLGEIARARKLWFHVDAAWGGSLLASDRLLPELSGIEDADSVTVDAHKWFATTMSCGMFIARHASVLAEAFHTKAGFMPSTEAHDPYMVSTQWSRRFLGLRLFVALAVAGWRGYADHLERAIDLAELLKLELTARGWTVVNRSCMAVVCAVPPAGYRDARSIAADIVASGRAWVSCAGFRGRDVVRMCITNGRTSARDVLDLVGLLMEIGRSRIGD